MNNSIPLKFPKSHFLKFYFKFLIFYEFGVVWALLHNCRWEFSEEKLKNLKPLIFHACCLSSLMTPYLRHCWLLSVVKLLKFLTCLRLSWQTLARERKRKLPLSTWAFSLVVSHIMYTCFTCNLIKLSPVNRHKNCLILFLD